MTVPAPYSLPSTSSWQLMDWLDQSTLSAPAAGGAITITLPALDSDTQWLVTRAVIGCTSTASTGFRLYVDGPANANLRSGSNSGNYDEADYPQGLLIRPGRALVAAWTGCTDGAIAVLNLQAQILKRVTS